MSKYRDEKWLYAEYVEKRKTVTQIAEESNVSREVIIESLNHFGIFRPLPKDIHPKRW
jgi:hypothetical protein